MNLLQHIEHDAVQGGSVFDFDLLRNDVKKIEVIERVDNDYDKQPDENGRRELQAMLKELSHQGWR